MGLNQQPLQIDVNETRGHWYVKITQGEFSYFRKGFARKNGGEQAMRDAIDGGYEELKRWAYVAQEPLPPPLKLARDQEQ